MTQAAAAAAKNGSEPKKPRTKQLPGLEDKHDPEVSALALKLRTIRVDRVALQAKEAEAHKVLLAKMVEKKLLVYRDVENEFVVKRVVGKEKATVEKLVFDEDGESSGDGAKEG